MQPTAKTIPFPKNAAAPPQPSRLELLLNLEGTLRTLPTRQAVQYHAVNDASHVMGFSQGFAFRFDGRDKPRIDAVSSVAKPDMNAPYMRAMLKFINGLKSKDKLSLVPVAEVNNGYGIWVPLLDRKGQRFGGLLWCRAEQWGEADKVIAERLGLAYAHAISALTPPKMLRTLSMPRWATLAAAALLVGMSFFPVHLTALAPFEVVPENPTLVTAPIEGVVAKILVDANTPVTKGTAVLQFDTTVLNSEKLIAEQKVSVARARLQSAQSGAFKDSEAKRSLAVTARELELAEAELAYANELLSQVTLAAPADGILVYTSRNDWIGKPVRVGEKIMEIADRDQVAYRIDLGVHDSIALAENSNVRFFLDADPLNPRHGKLVEQSYHARENAERQLTYKLKALPQQGDQAVRLGLRGTAQISGEKVSLGFYLLRRPIAALRQYLGI